MSLGTKTNIPICKFGPGGDYQWDYIPEHKNQCVGLLTPVTETVKYIIRSISYRLPVCAGSSVSNQEHNSFERRQSRECNTDKTRDTKNILSLSAEQTIFTDDAGTGRPAPKEPRNRVRALRRTPRKRFSVCLSGQSPLFETH
jgi:hypothetical protein